MRDQSGATAIEYGLIVGLMAAIVVSVLGIFGDRLEDLFQAVADKLGQAAESVSGTNSNP
ncbi:MAG: Flp family type IVb pilin [Deltaproteobacteria bacterium]|nr:Flp family type IVb pilin [Deltaproteobacteria bacterium]